MKCQSKQKTALVTVLFVVAAAAQVGLSVAQDTLDERAIRDLVDKALPRWSDSMLDVEEGRDWIGRVSFENVYGVMGDRPPQVEKIPGRAQRLGDDTRVVVLDRGRGRVRYVNRARGWSYKTDAQSKAVEPSKALEMVMGAVSELGLPRGELAQARVDTQMGGGAPTGEKELRDRFEMYRIVSVPRTVGEFPVYGSHVRGAVSNRGEIQRLMVEWPSFRMPGKLEMREREAVVREAVKEIAAQDPQGEISIKAVLAYAAASQDDEESFFAPSVVISVQAPPTPYQFVVPVADPSR